MHPHSVTVTSDRLGAGSNPARPGSNPVCPGSNPARPGSNPGRPGSNPARPGSNPARPGSNPEGVAVLLAQILARIAAQRGQLDKYP